MRAAEHALRLAYQRLSVSSQQLADAGAADAGSRPVLSQASRQLRFEAYQLRAVIRDLRSVAKSMQDAPSVGERAA